MHFLKTRIPPAIIIGLMLWSPIDASAAPYFLYWSKVFVRTSSESRCMQFAYHVATQKLHQVKRSNLEVSGSGPNAYVSMTCIGTPQRAMAVVMVVSDSDAAARNLRDQIASAVQREISFD